MSSDPEILLPLVAAGGAAREAATYIVFSVYYENGPSFRGIVMAARPEYIGESTRIYTLCSGARTALLPLARSSPKRVASAVTHLFADVQARRGEAWALVQHVAQKNGLELLHTVDEDCDVGADGCCTGCGVSHTALCPCGGRGFHREGCNGAPTPQRVTPTDTPYARAERGFADSRSE